MGLQHQINTQVLSAVGLSMLVTIRSYKDEEWSHMCYYYKEDSVKYYVWTNKFHTVEMHYPKHTYYCMPLRESE